MSTRFKANGKIVGAFKMVRGLKPIEGELATVADVAGLDAALSLMRHFGASCFHFPSAECLNSRHRLARAIGLDAARRVCRELGGTQIIVPLGPFTHSAVSIYRFAKLRRDGASIGEAARDVSICRRTGHGWNAAIESGAISDRDFCAYGRAIGDDWDSPATLPNRRKRQTPRAPLSETRHG